MITPITAVQTQPSAKVQNMCNTTQTTCMMWTGLRNPVQIYTISKFENKDKPIVKNKEPNTISCFLPGPNQDNDMRMNVEITQQLQREFNDILMKYVALICFHCS